VFHNFFGEKVPVKVKYLKKHVKFQYQPLKLSGVYAFRWYRDITVDCLPILLRFWEVGF
jgi:hypothetical protein